MEMNESVKSVLAIDSNSDSYLRQILKYKHWYFADALKFLLGYKDLNWFDSNENTLLTLSEKVVTETDCSDLFLFIQMESSRLTEIWEHSGINRELKPIEFIDWAKRVGFEPVWLKYAMETGLVEPEDKPLSEKERDTFLIIIAALAKEAKIDVDKTSKAGELIASMTQKMGCSVGATTIEEKLKLISNAIENRTR